MRDQLAAAVLDFRQPLPDRLKPMMSTGYLDATKPPVPYEIVSLPPAGSLAATGTDMGNFMIAHLQNGKFGDGQIMKPETAVQISRSMSYQLRRLRIVCDSWVAVSIALALAWK